MLSQTQRLLQTTQGRYATDAELTFLEDYAKTFPVRLRAYQKIRQQEKQLMQQVYQNIRSQHPELLNNQPTMIKLWQRDTLLVLRFTALILLMDDVDTLRDRLILWFQTIMRAFGMQKICLVTYTLMQKVVKQLLDPAEAKLFCDILEIHRSAFDLPDVV
jgi:hypothetical protein